jgi:hypothetical protein
MSNSPTVPTPALIAAFCRRSSADQQARIYAIGEVPASRGLLRTCELAYEQARVLAAHLAGEEAITRGRARHQS